MKKLLIISVATTCFATVFADAHTWKSSGLVNNWNWAEPRNFEEGIAPSAGDTVTIPASLEVFATNAASLEIVSSLDQIFPTDAKSRIVFAVGEGNTFSITNCAICSTAKHSDSDHRIGEIVKRGKGTLVLARADGHPEQNDRAPSYTDRFAYNTDIIVEEGVLKLPTTAETGSYSHWFGHVSVSNGATLFTVSGGNFTVPMAIWGEGTIMNADASTRTLRVNGRRPEDACEFAGTIGGSIAYESCGNVRLLGRANTFMGGMAAYCDDQNSRINLDDLASCFSMTGIGKFGRIGEAATVPSTTAALRFGSNGGRYVYLGDEPESTDHGFYVAMPTTGPVCIDGGHYGGLTVSGAVTMVTSSRYEGMTMVGLAGSNEVPCVIAGAVQLSNSNDFFFVKTGLGKWRFADTARANADRTFASTITVKEGTLQFDSLAEAGKVCSLGIATNLSVAYYGGHTKAYATNYAFFAGAKAGKIAALEYVGTNRVSVATRPIGLTGGLSLKNDTTHPWGVYGVGNATSGAVTLDLTGSGMAGSEVHGIVDSAETPISVTKTGSGTWILNGSNTIHGTISVKGGVLKVRAANAYDWFRWTVRGRAASGIGNMYARELGIYDADGNRLNALLDVSNTDWLNLSPGQAAFGRTGVTMDTASGSTLDKLFSGLASNYLQFWLGGSLWTETVESKPETWIPVVMHLSEGSAIAETYDFCSSDSYNGGNAKRIPTSWKMEGSVDGVHWDILSETNNAQPLANMWVGNGRVYSGDANDLPHTGGMKLRRFDTTVFDDVRSVFVATNATLEAIGDVTINALTLDANGNGTIKGFTFAANGCLDVVNLSRSVTDHVFNATFTDAKGLANLANWRLSLNGVVTSKKRIVVSADGKVKIYSLGMKIILR